MVLLMKNVKLQDLDVIISIMIIQIILAMLNALLVKKKKIMSLFIEKISLLLIIITLDLYNHNNK
jgi:hypothetical protein